MIYNNTGNFTKYRIFKCAIGYGLWNSFINWTRWISTVHIINQLSNSHISFLQHSSFIEVSCLDFKLLILLPLDRSSFNVNFWTKDKVYLIQLLLIDFIPPSLIILEGFGLLGFRVHLQHCLIINEKAHVRDQPSPSKIRPLGKSVRR